MQPYQTAILATTFRRLCFCLADVLWGAMCVAVHQRRKSSSFGHSQLLDSLPETCLTPPCPHGGVPTCMIEAAKSHEWTDGSRNHAYAMMLLVASGALTAQ
eukprot:scaffold40845_cov32-Tisochrysis_lutea.AAC.3